MGDERKKGRTGARENGAENRVGTARLRRSNGDRGAAGEGRGRGGCTGPRHKSQLRAAKVSLRRGKRTHHRPMARWPRGLSDGLGRHGGRGRTTAGPRGLVLQDLQQAGEAAQSILVSRDRAAGLPWKLQPRGEEAAEAPPRLGGVG